MMNKLRFYGRSAFGHYTLLLLLWAVAAMAWSQNFSISHTMTPGQCTADGALTVNITSTASANTQFQYLLKNLTTNAEPTPVRTTARSYTFNNLTAGRYRVDVSMVSGGAPQTIDNINVTTAYVPMAGGFNQTLSRDAYDCGTGRIVITVRNGRGAYTMRVLSGPMRVNETIATTRIANTDDYQLAHENWKPGTYKIEVKDECQNTFVLDVLLANMGAISQKIIFNGGRVQSDCQSFVWYKDYTSGLTSAELKHADAGFYEIGYQFPGQSDSEIQWFNYERNNGRSEVRHTVNAPQDFYALYEYYKANYPSETINNGQYSGFSQDIYYKRILRLKVCPDTKVEDRSNLNLDSRVEMIPLLFRMKNCDDMRLWVYTHHTPYCLPITFEVSAKAKGVTYGLGNVTLVKRGASLQEKPSFSISSLPWPEDNQVDTIFLKGRDAKGRTMEYKYLWARNYYIKPLYGSQCGYDLELNHGFTLRKIEPNGTLSGTINRFDQDCGVKWKLYNSDKTQLIVERMGADAILPNLQYGTTYRLEIHVGGKVTEQTIRYNLPPTGQLRIETYPDYEAINYGRFGMYIPGRYGAGSVLTLKDPNGKVIMQKTFETAGTGVYTSIGQASEYGTYPPGVYTATFDDPCLAQPQIATFTHKFFTQVDLTYDVTHGCNVAYITPRVKAEEQNRNGTIVPLRVYIFIQPKNQAVQEIVANSGERIAISKEGDYTLSVAAKETTYSVYIANLNKDRLSDLRMLDYPITYKTPSLSIDTTKTLAYACGANVIGDIVIQARGGVAPYTYQLFHDAKHQQPVKDVNGADVKSTGNTAHFKHGKAGDTYYVRYTDNCGSYQNYTVTLANVTDLQLGYATPSPVCIGEAVQLRVIGPESLVNNANVTWRDPKGGIISGSGPHRTISNMQNANAGIYKLTFTLSGCGISVTNNVKVDMVPTLVGTNPPQSKYSVCVGELAKIQGATTTAANTTIHWEHAAGGRLLNPNFFVDPSVEQYRYIDWTTHPSLAHGSTSTLSMRFDKPGAYFLRNVITRGCAFTSVPIEVVVQRCVVPVNPHLMHRPVADWSSLGGLPPAPFR